LRVAVLEPQAPLRSDDRERLAARLCEALREHGTTSS